jgi:hypothetical protein
VSYIYAADEDGAYVKKEKGITLISNDGESEKEILSEDDIPEPYSNIFVWAQYEQDLLVSMEYEDTEYNGQGRATKRKDFIFNLDNKTFEELDKNSKYVKG